MNWKPMFASVFWPAAAGNVFWSFCTLITESLPAEFSWAVIVWPLRFDFIPDWDLLARLVVLMLLAAYLSINWMRVSTAKKDAGFVYWLFDFVHIWTIIFAALVAHYKPEFLEFFLGIVFAWAALGHASKKFADGEVDEAAQKEAIDNRFRLARLNLYGVGILLINWAFDWTWFAPISVVVVLSLWLASGRLEKLKEAYNSLAESGP